MENNVTSLETSKLLKEARFPQDTPCAWFYTRIPQSLESRWNCISNNMDYAVEPLAKGEELIAAPTAQEIADQLPGGTDLFKHDGYWAALGSSSWPEHAVGPTMAEALAALWIKLN